MNSPSSSRRYSGTRWQRITCHSIDLTRLSCTVDSRMVTFSGSLKAVSLLLASSLQRSPAMEVLQALSHFQDTADVVCMLFATFTLLYRPHHTPLSPPRLLALHPPGNPFPRSPSLLSSPFSLSPLPPTTHSVLNASYNCVDRWAYKNPDKVSLSYSPALLWLLADSHSAYLPSLSSITLPITSVTPAPPIPSRFSLYPKWHSSLPSPSGLLLFPSFYFPPLTPPRDEYHHRPPSSGKQTNPAPMLSYPTTSSFRKYAESPTCSSPSASRRVM